MDQAKLEQLSDLLWDFIHKATFSPQSKIEARRVRAEIEDCLEAIEDSELVTE